MNKWVVMGVLALFAGVASAQQQLPPGGKEFQTGQEAFKKKDWDAAITAFESAVEQNDQLFASYYFLGFAYQNRGNYEKTAENFLKFLDKVPNDPQAAEMTAAATRQGGVALARSNQFEQSIPLLKKAASAKPNDAEVIFYLAMSQMMTGDEPGAEQNFAKVTQLQPALDRPYYYAGRIAFNREAWANAKTRLNKYLELKPDGQFAPEAHFMLGSMAMRDNDKTRAKSHLQQFLQLKPNGDQAAQAHYILGSLAAQAEDLETARTHFQRYLALEPNGPYAQEVRTFLADLK